MAIPSKRSVARKTVTPEEHRRMIAEAAYGKAEQRGFVPGYEEQDWREAEQEVATLIEHRHGNRQALAEPITVALYDKGKYVGTGQIRNVARHGLFIAMEASCEEDAYVRAEFCIPPDGDSYRPWGRVAHNRKGGIGLALDVLDPYALAALRAVSQHAEKGWYRIAETV